MYNIVVGFWIWTKIFPSVKPLCWLPEKEDETYQALISEVPNDVPMTRCYYHHHPSHHPPLSRQMSPMTRSRWAAVPGVRRSAGGRLVNCIPVASAGLMLSLLRFSCGSHWTEKMTKKQTFLLIFFVHFRLSCVPSKGKAMLAKMGGSGKNLSVWLSIDIGPQAGQQQAAPSGHSER